MYSSTLYFNFSCCAFSLLSLYLFCCLCLKFVHVASLGDPRSFPWNMIVRNYLFYYFIFRVGVQEAPKNALEWYIFSDCSLKILAYFLKSIKKKKKTLNNSEYAMLEGDINVPCSQISLFVREKQVFILECNACYDHFYPISLVVNAQYKWLEYAYTRGL